VCTFEERRGIGRWKMGMWRLKGARENADQWMCPVHGKEGIMSCNVKEQGTRGTYRCPEYCVVNEADFV
jgi:predicted RNA-binding Zn-ribbon protein involved in translation (DUF1610 family)